MTRQIRAKTALLCLSLAAALASAALTRAEEPPPAALSEAQLDEAWTVRLSDATARRDSAAERVRADESALRVARHRRYPRGVTRGALEQNLEHSRHELETAREAVPELLEQARRAGVSPAVLRRFEAE